MQLTLHLTLACNLRCTYCYYRDFAPGEMTLATALAAADLALDRTADHLAVTFFGGEPLLAAELICELVPRIRHRALARGKVATFKLPTNGHRLDDRLLAFFEQNAVFVSLSIDGDAAANHHRRTADGADAFAPTLAALRRLARDATTFATYSVVTPHNAAHLDAAMRFLHAEGARILVSALDHGAAWTPAALRALGRAYRRLGDFYTAEVEAGRPLYLSPFDAKIEAHTRPDPLGAGCSAGLTQLSVAPDGALYPCVQFVEHPEHRIGHVDTGLDPGALAPLEPHADPDEPCADCGIRDRCGRDCACVRYQSEGDPAALSALVCAHERLLTPIADRVARRLYRRRVPLFVQKHYNPAYDRLRALEAVIEAARPSPGARS